MVKQAGSHVIVFDIPDVIAMQWLREKLQAERLLGIRLAALYFVLSIAGAFFSWVLSGIFLVIAIREARLLRQVTIALSQINLRLKGDPQQAAGSQILPVGESFKDWLRGHEIDTDTWPAVHHQSVAG